MAVRRMELGDAEAVAGLSGQLGYPATAEQVLVRFRAVASDPDHGVFVAVDAAGRVNGWVHVHGRHLLESEPFAELGGIVVDAAARGQGVGKALVAAAEAWGTSRGYARLVLRSNSIRTEAHEFYRHIGYSVTKSQIVFAKGLGSKPGTDGTA